MIQCKLCGDFFKELVGHVPVKHNMLKKEYLQKFPGAEYSHVRRFSRIGDADVRAKIKSSMAIKFEGGHNMRDPNSLMRRKFQSLVLGYNYNHESFKKTCLEKYGVAHPMHDPVIKAKATARSKENFVLSPGAFKKMEMLPRAQIEDACRTESSVASVGIKLGIGEELTRKWLTELGLRPTGSPKDRVVETPRQVVQEYYKLCHAHGRLISFHECCKIAGKPPSYTTKLNRMFGSSGKYNHLRDKLMSSFGVCEEELLALL